MAFDFESAFKQALPYEEFLTRHGTSEQARRWHAVHEQVSLSPQQKGLLEGFRRRMNVLCLAGVWCGDCVNACPIFQRFAEASPAIALRFVHRPQEFHPRDGSPDTALAQELSICASPRVPVLVFLSEDWHECERFGDRTLATYRVKVAHMGGPWCPTGLVAPHASLQEANVKEWLDHFERVQWMLVTSPRLMRLHGEI